MTRSKQLSPNDGPATPPKTAQFRRRMPCARRIATRRWISRTQISVRLLAIGLCLTPAIIGRAQQQTSFNYGIDATPPGFNGAMFYGDAYANGTQATLALHAASNNTSYGAVYYPNAVDITSGFDTAFVVNDGNVQHLSLMLRGSNETRPLIPFTGGATVQNIDYGFSGMTSSVAIEFDFNPLIEMAYFDRPTLVGDILLSHDTGNAFAYGPIAAGPFGNTQHNIRIRYSALSKVLQVFTEGQLAFEDRTFNFGDYGPAASVYIGLIAANTPDFTQSFGPMSLNSWQFGNDITPNFGPGVYLEPMTFTTSQQSIWNNNSDSVEWNQIFSVSGSTAGTKASSNDGFSGGLTYNFNDTAGLRFDATAQGGLMDVNYPLLLNMTLPPQQSVLPGNSFTITTGYTPDPGATFTTTSPSARFQAYLTLITQNYTGFSLGFPSPFNFADINSTLFNFGTNVNDVEFFDTDFILQNAADFGFVQGQYENVVALKGDSGVGGTKTQTYGGSDTGTTKGSGKDDIPLDFISLNMMIPNLGANGFLSFDANTPTQVQGTAASDIIGVHADFTEALMDLCGLGDFSALINTDVAFNIPTFGETDFGWHIADLYGDLNLGARLQHTLQPHPQLTLHFTDINNNSVGIPDMQIDLPDDGSSITTPPITMPSQPLQITPTVTFGNTLNTSATLTLHGDLDLNAFQMYITIPDLININAQVLLPIADGTFDLATVNEPGFELGGFQPITGKPIVLTPASDTNPYSPTNPTPNPAIVTPAVQMPRLTTNHVVSLSTINVTPDAEVVLDLNTPSQMIISNSYVSVSSPNALTFLLPPNVTAQRGTHTVTLVNSSVVGGNPAFPITPQTISNTITLTVTELLPTLSAVSPMQVVLTTPRTDLNGNPLLQNDPNNPNAQYMTLTISGNKFAPGAVVRWNGMSLITQQVSADQLTASVPAAYLNAAGSVNVTVYNGGPGGGQSRPQAVTLGYPVPTLRQLGLSTSFAGANGVTTMLYGANFTPASQALWNGSPKPTTFISSKQLEVQIAAADLVKAGQAQISIDNGPDTLNLNKGQELLSRSLAFTVGSAPVRTVLQVTPTLTRAANGDYLVSVRIKNIGSSNATGLVMSSIYTTDTQNAHIAAQNTPGLPALFGTLKPGASVTLPGTTRLPASVGQSGSVRPLTVLGSFSQGSFTTTLRVTLP